MFSLPDRSKPAPVSKSTIHFLDLGRDIHYLIIEELHQISKGSVLALAQVSKAFQAISIPILYHSLALSDAGTTTTTRLLHSLLSLGHQASDLVRNISIEDFGQRPSMFDVLDLVDILVKAKYLQSFCWKAQFAIPEVVVETLEKCHPRSKLGILNKRRHKIPADNPLFLSSISSSYLLDSLTYDVYWDQSHVNKQCVSEVSIINRTISQSPNIRQATLQLSWLSSGYHILQPVIGPIDDSNLSSSKSREIPHLHRLQLSATPTGFTSKLKAGWAQVTRDLLTQSAQWSHLNQLDLSGLCPGAALQLLTTRVPNLKILILANGRNLARRFWDPRALRGFMAGIKALRKLVISNTDDNADIELLWTAISQHRQSLQTFRFHTLPDPRGLYVRRFCWTAEQLQELLSSPLEHLEIDISTETAAWLPPTTYHQTGANTEAQGEVTMASVLPRFKQLVSMKLWVLPLCRDGSESEASQRAFNRQQAQDVAIALFQQIHENPDARLRKLELRFVRILVCGYRRVAKMRSVWVKSADEGRDRRGHFSVLCQSGWRER